MFDRVQLSPRSPRHGVARPHTELKICSLFSGAVIVWAMTEYFDIQRLLAESPEFAIPMRGLEALITKVRDDRWHVSIDDVRIGSFGARSEGRAFFFASEIPSEPEVTNWVSDDITTLIGRMLDLRE